MDLTLLSLSIKVFELSSSSIYLSLSVCLSVCVYINDACNFIITHL